MSSCSHRTSRWVCARHFPASKDGFNHCDLNNMAHLSTKGLEISSLFIFLESVSFVFLYVISDQYLSVGFITCDYIVSL